MRKKLSTDVRRPCATCGRDFWASKYHVAHGSTGLVYCTRACYLASCARQPLADRFWQKVHKTDGCWLWMGRRGRAGHGMADDNGRAVYAHRWAWESINGPIPEGLVICHVCDNPPCVNPAHLALGTPADNHADMWRKGRGHSLPKKVGTHHPNAKFSDADVAAIRARYAAGGVSQRRLAQEYGVSQGAIAHITNRRNWSHLS